ncbi:MAG: hypothetical protein A3D92_09075 [Bacteroidetes bacterium RIFCSPHIGHO2_02_FULL_44_7]|nr:MAG: hypothetical protein A3D92_09075 [Bacteroidetes bacterium RIFCSPHIGHO2_02_FULL_44_7]
MKTGLILFISFFALSFAPSQQKTVFLCDNGTTEVYHLDKDCSALRRCTHGVIPLSLPEAKEKGLRACGLED